MKIMPRTSLLPTQRIVFLPSALDSVKMVAKRGLTDNEICDYFGIPLSLFNKWLKAYPSFRDTLEEGRTEADVRVVEALHKSAVGYHLKHKKTTIQVKNGRKTRRTVITESPVAGSVDAQKFWLTNRDKKHWKNRVSSESDVRAQILVEDRRKLIDGLFSELISDPKQLINVTPEPSKPK